MYMYIRMVKDYEGGSCCYKLLGSWHDDDIVVVTGNS